MKPTKEQKQARAKQIGQGINKMIIDKGRMINDMKIEKMEKKKK